jgi:hypothetical protein
MTARRHLTDAVTLLVAIGVAAITIAIIAVIAIALTPEPPLPPPNGLGPDGLYPVATPRTTEEVDRCALLSPDEVEKLLGPEVIALDMNDNRCRFSSSIDLDHIDVITDLHIFDEPDPAIAPNAIVAGYPALVTVPQGYRYCAVYVITNPEPGRANLGVYWPGQLDCEAVTDVAELVIPRLPLRAQ